MDQNNDNNDNNNDNNDNSRAQGGAGQGGKRAREETLTIVHPRIRRAPLDISAGPDAGVEVGVHKDGSVLGVPGAAQRAEARDVQGRIGGSHAAVVDVGPVVVREGCVCALPGCDPAVWWKAVSVVICKEMRG